MALRPDDILGEAAETFRSRNPIYGDGWVRVGETLKALFPDGLTLASARDHERYTQIVMIAVKLTRYTNDFQKPHADSIRDLTVYGAILEHIDAKTSPRMSDSEAADFLREELAAAFRDGKPYHGPMKPRTYHVDGDLVDVNDLGNG